MPDSELNTEVKHISLYRKYRPQKFSEIAGQAAAVDMLVSALSSSGVGHAYLFSGPRGCGKTTAARLLAKALNCLNNKNSNSINIEPCGHCENCVAITEGESLDVVEIDGASNNTVDEARELKSQANLAPFNSKYKIYIIDEVHMLSIAAFNALLKIMEEPPDYVIFILATTEPHKVPVTIRSRCQHIPFHRINVKDIFNQLTKICDSEHENIQAQPEALWEIARQADGGMRDALSLLEQVINTAKINSASTPQITLNDVELAVGAGSRPELEKWLAGLMSGADDDKNESNDNSENQNNENIKNSYIEFKNILEACTSPERVFEELFSVGRNLWLASMWPDIIDTLDVSEFENDFLKQYASKQRSGRSGAGMTANKLKLFLNAVLRMIKQSRLDFGVDVLFGMFTLELDNIINGEAQIAASLPYQPEIGRSVSSVIKGSGRRPEGYAGGDVERSEPEKYLPEKGGKASLLFNEINKINKIKGENVSDSGGEDKRAVEDFAEDFNELKSLDWEKFAEEDDKKFLDAAHGKNFVLYCILLDAEFFKCGGKLLLKFDSAHCYETARIERNTFLIEDIIKLNLNSEYDAVYFNFNGVYFEYKIEAESGKINKSGKSENKDYDVPTYIKNKNAVKNLDKNEKNYKNVKIEGSAEKEANYKRTIADEFAQLLGGQIVMVKNDDNTEDENYDADNENEADNETEDDNNLDDDSLN